MSPLENRCYELYLLIGNEAHRLGNEDGADTDGLDDAMSELAEIQEAVKVLEISVSAERARRIKAEEVVDYILRRPLVYGANSAWDICQEYRAQYPRVEQEKPREP